MSRYPVYGVQEDIWSRGIPNDSPYRGHSHPPQPQIYHPSMTNIPQTHTTIVHSTSKPLNDADMYRVGIYGWRKRCLYGFILALTVVIVLNLALTVWIMSVLDFSTEGMGPLKIEENGIRVMGKAQFDHSVHFSHLSTARDEALTIDSFRGLRLQARNSSGQVSSLFNLGSNGKAEAFCRRFEVSDQDNKLLFFADSEEIGLKLDNLRILDDGGSVFEGAIQTAQVRPEPDTPLQLESPTRSVSIDAAQDIELLTSAGELKAQALLDISLISKKGEIRLESSSVFLEGLPRSVGRGTPQSQLCACHDGRLFLAVQSADCRADRYICQ